MDDLISRQAAIDVEGLDEQIRCEMCKNPMQTDRGCDGHCKYDVKLYERIMQILGERIKPFPPAQPEPRWIPCSERLPDEDYWTGANFQYSADVLMTVYNAEDEETIIDYGHTADGSWYSDTTDGLVPPWWKVLAWMPLPEPYKEV